MFCDTFAVQKKKSKYAYTYSAAIHRGNIKDPSGE